MDDRQFSQCPCCGTWFSRQDILENPAVVPLGMAFDGDQPRSNLLYFNHVHPACGSTFTIEAHRFRPFLSESEPPDMLAGRPECEHHCTSMNDLSVCHNDCRWSPYRRFLVDLSIRKRTAV